MRYARWLDHLPVWLAYGAVATTGIYEPWELVVMAVPVLLAGVVEALRMDLGRWRKELEILAVVVVVLDFLTHSGFFGVVIHTLFLLCGLRLALPREVPQRRQLLLMGFLLFLTTAISTADLAFLAWALLWLGGAATVLLQLSWEHSASLRRGPTLRPPYGRVPYWALSALAIASGFFLILPRLTLGWHPLPSLGAALSGLQAGLSNQVDLGEAGRLQDNGEVVMRVIPPQGLEAERLASMAQEMGYFRGFALEYVNGMVWKPVEATPTLPVEEFDRGMLPRGAGTLPLELYLAPTPQRIITLPYGASAVSLPYAGHLRHEPGGGLRLPFATTQGVPIKVLWTPPRDRPLWEEPPKGRRKAFLTRLGPDHAAALRAGLGWAPANASTKQAVDLLTAHLQGFRYTLDNPSGGAANPLQDFLEHSKAGHCEFFASSLALMLRARGIPARVASGYRLGAWVPEGGYFLVTQNEAHAWVEYWDEADQRWHLADASPAGSAAAAQGFSATWGRWADVVRFRWNRYVVRFSDEDQQGGLGKVKDLATGWRWQWRRPSALATWALGLTALLWIALRLRRRWSASSGARPPQGLRELRPLLARTRTLAPPFEGETLRAWLLRLAGLRPERAAALAQLADAAERALYGGRDAAALRALAREEARAWRAASE